VVFVGADNGLYAMSTTQAGIWSRLRGAIPNALVRDLDYDATDDILLIATLGRGTWMIAHPEISRCRPRRCLLRPSRNTDRKRLRSR
jgi:hypothetical protein